jgi:hypothetical protein
MRAIISRRDALSDFVIAVGSDAQILWITLWLTWRESDQKRDTTGLPSRRLYFEHRFLEQNQALARRLGHAVRAHALEARPLWHLWTTADL